MILKQEITGKKLGLVTGYFIGYSLLTTVLSLIVTIFHESVTIELYIRVISITLCVSLIGAWFRRFLEINDKKRTSAGLRTGLKLFSDNIIIVVNSILLFTVYLLGVGVTSVIAKISGKHFLENRVSRKEQSYWSNLNLKKEPINTYFRQF